MKHQHSKKLTSHERCCMLIAMALCTMLLNSCVVQDATGGVDWYLCINAKDSLEIQCPVSDDVIIQDTISEYPEWVRVDNACAKTSGDVYIQGTYFYSNKGDYKYAHTERKFTIKRLTANAPVRVILAYHMVQPDNYGWMPRDAAKRDSVFNVLVEIYGEEKVVTIPTDCSEKTLSFKP